jgi:hypothetical protein
VPRLRQRLRGLRRLRWRLRRRLLYMDWTCVYLTDFYWGQNDPAVSEAITGPVVGLVSMAAAFVMTVNGTAGRARRLRRERDPNPNYKTDNDGRKQDCEDQEADPQSSAAC